ncbi:MAG: sigma-70 family RNA polymerase sigma factor [Chloroflexi bacterium]|nr:sigma-70 family RNA polymerase sigma factor [Chloroflexota bacterium]
MLKWHEIYFSQPQAWIKTMLFSESQDELNSLRKLDPQAISAIYDRYFQDIYRFILYRLNDESLAEDISGDVFLRLLEAVKKKRGPKKNIKAWLLSTASHIITDHLRRRYRRPTESLPENLEDQSDSPSTLFDRSHQNNLTREAFQHLTSEQQNVLNLRFGQGYSLEETATVMKKKTNAIKALQFRALAALRRQVGEVA